MGAVIVDGTGGIVYDDNGSSIGSFFSFSSPANAFGIWLATSVDSTVTIGGGVASAVVLTAGVPAFFGVIVTMTTFTSLTFDASGGPNVGFDAASYGSVPEPATLLLLSTGLGVVAYRRRRKS